MKNKVKLSITDNTVWYGDDQEGFYSTLLLTGKATSTFDVIPNVKSTIKLGQFNIGSIIQDADCSFSGTGEGTLAQKTLSVCDKKINLEYCVTTFEQDYLSKQMRAGVTEEVMPNAFENYILGQVALKANADIEAAAFSNTTSGACTGLVLTMLADSDVVDVAVTSSAITSATVIGELTRVYNAIPNTVLASKGNDEMVIYVSQAIASAYKLAQAAVTGGLFMVGDKEMDFLGIPIVVSPGLGAKQMVATWKGNLLLLTDLVSELDPSSGARIIPQINVSGAPTVRIVAHFKLGFGYRTGAEIVLYS